MTMPNFSGGRYTGPAIILARRTRGVAPKGYAWFVQPNGDRLPLPDDERVIRRTRR
jgi:hypothetical protein